MLSLERSAIRGNEEEVVRIVVLGYIARDLISARGPLVRALVSRGKEVLCIATDFSSEDVKLIEGWGAKAVNIALSRSDVGPIEPILGILRIARMLRASNADAIFCYNIKPIVYGLLAARILGVRNRVAMITGLGYAFTDGAEVRRRIVGIFARLGYVVTLPLAHRVVFQNRDDLEYATKLGVKPSQTMLVNGSGVNLSYFRPQPLPTGTITFLMIARLLVDKGIREYVDAAKRVREVRPDARFILVGPFDPNPAAISERELKQLVQDGNVTYLGVREDIRELLAACHVYVLPSYREGMPRTVLEAMAVGRPVITTDVPGCRDSIEKDVCGWIVPARDARSLAEAMLTAANADLEAFGAAAVSVARRKFCADMIAEQLADVLCGGQL